MHVLMLINFLAMDDFYFQTGRNGSRTDVATFF